MAEKLKIIKITEKDNHKTLSKFYADGNLIAVCEVGRDYYCTVKNGTPSRTRNKLKRTFSTSWNREGLSKLLSPHIIAAGDFENDYPDLTYGYQGSILTAVSIRKALAAFIKKTLNGSK